MPVLANFQYNINPAFAVERSLTWGYALGWWNMTIINPEQPTILREIPFGGYRVTLKFKDWFWNYRGGAARIPDILDDLYATPPAGGAPISVGTCIVNVQWDTLLQQYIVVYALSPSDNHFFLNKLPPLQPPYWTLPGHPQVVNVPAIIDA